MKADRFFTIGELDEMGERFSVASAQIRSVLDSLSSCSNGFLEDGWGEMAEVAVRADILLDQLEFLTKGEVQLMNTAYGFAEEDEAEIVDKKQY